MSNNEAVEMNIKIQQVFANESQAFFSERLRWKSDA